MQEYSVNLGLDITPFTKDKDSLYDIYKLYNAVRSLAYALDLYTGALVPSPPTGATLSVYGKSYCRVQNISRIFITFAVSASAGQMISIDASGNAILGVTGSVVGWAPHSVTGGDVGEVKLLGLCTNYSGLTPGTMYYSAGGGNISSTPSAQKIGFAIDATSLFVNPA